MNDDFLSDDERETAYDTLIRELLCDLGMNIGAEFDDDMNAGIDNTLWNIYECGNPCFVISLLLAE
jgi:hypothetical protein